MASSEEERGILSDIAAAVQHGAEGVSASGMMGKFGLPDVQQGFKDVLSAAALRAIKKIGVVDGFLNNESIKILIPEKMQPIASALRSLGQGARVDELELSMNRAAERSVPKAAEIFVGAIANLKFADVKAIWESPTHTGASEFLERECSSGLQTAFLPEILAAMEEHRVTKHFDDIMAVVGKIPFVSEGVKSFDIRQFTLKKALDGLFKVCKEKEIEVRTHPEMRPTQIVQAMFRHLDQPAALGVVTVVPRGDHFVLERSLDNDANTSANELAANAADMSLWERAAKEIKDGHVNPPPPSAGGGGQSVWEQDAKEL